MSFVDQMDVDMNELSFKAQDAMEAVLVLHESEQKFYGAKKYWPAVGETPAAGSSENDGSSDASGTKVCRNRKELVQWCFKVVDYYELPRYIVEWTMNLVDRYFYRYPEHSTSSAAFKAMTAVAFRLVIKMDGGQSQYETKYNGDGSIARAGSDFARHTMAFLAVPHLVSSSSADRKLQAISSSFGQLEWLLLGSLKCHINVILTEDYLTQYMKLLPLSGVMGESSLLALLYNRATAIAESSIGEAYLLTSSRSYIALASLLCAMRLETTIHYETVQGWHNFLSTSAVFHYIIGANSKDTRSTGCGAKQTDNNKIALEILQKKLLEVYLCECDLSCSSHHDQVDLASPTGVPQTNKICIEYDRKSPTSTVL